MTKDDDPGTDQRKERRKESKTPHPTALEQRKEETSSTGVWARYLAVRGAISGAPRVAFLVLGLLAVSGLLSVFVERLGWGMVFESARALLDDSMTSATVNTFVLVGVKSGLEMIQSVEGSVGIVSGNLGALVAHGPYELVAFAFRFFLLSMGLIAVQISLLEIIQLSALPLLTGLGAFMLAFQPSINSLFGRLGRFLMVLGIVIYFVFPAILMTVGSAYETQRIDSEIQNTENFAILSERASDLSLRDLSSSSGRDQVVSTFTDGIQGTWGAFLNIVISYMLMFVIAPLAAVGLSWLLISQTMKSLNYTTPVQKTEDAGRKTLDWLRPKSKGE